MNQRPEFTNRLLHYRFIDFLGADDDERQAIMTLGEEYRDRLTAIGLDHFTYRSLHLDENDVPSPVCDIVYASPDWIEFYYASNAEARLTAIGQNQPPYQLAYFSKEMESWSAEYNEIVMKAYENGMACDFYFTFRDNNITGGGIAGGAFNEKLPKSALYQALGLGAEMNARISVHIGKAYEGSSGLTDTELKYLHLLLFGLSPRDIARTSQVTDNWVAKALMNLRRKLGVTSNTAAVAKALALRLLR